MSDLPGIVVTGVSGRMGQMLVRTIADSPRCTTDWRVGAGRT